MYLELQATGFRIAAALIILLIKLLYIQGIMMINVHDDLRVLE